MKSSIIIIVKKEADSFLSILQFLDVLMIAPLAITTPSLSDSSTISIEKSSDDNCYNK